jgi:hypothetical protein
MHLPGSIVSSFTREFSIFIQKIWGINLLPDEKFSWLKLITDEYGLFLEQFVGTEFGAEEAGLTEDIQSSLKYILDAWIFAINNANTDEKKAITSFLQSNEGTSSYLYSILKPFLIKQFDLV